MTFFFFKIHISAYFTGSKSLSAPRCPADIWLYERQRNRVVCFQKMLVKTCSSLWWQGASVNRPQWVGREEWGRTTAIDRSALDSFKQTCYSWPRIFLICFLFFLFKLRYVLEMVAVQNLKHNEIMLSILVSTDVYSFNYHHYQRKVYGMDSRF